MKIFFSLAVICLLLSSCATIGERADHIELKKTSYTELSGWHSQDMTNTFSAFRRSCDASAKKPEHMILQMGNLAATVRQWQRLCAQADNVNPTDNAAIHRFFEEKFEPFEVSNHGETTGLFTGYYEPLLKGSRKKHGMYQEPIYRLPPDIMMGKAYYRRDQINWGVLRGRHLEIAYVNDPVEAFFLQIQGSGRILLDNGQIIRVGYAGQNGHSYVAIGKYLKEKGYIAPENMSAQNIKRWLRNHKGQARRVMEMNPSYVFFREVKNEGGPIGAQGIPLTDTVSLAVDRRYIPYGVPLWLDTTLPDGSAFKRLMVAQDTGGAIKGPVRGDIFFGFGKEAERYAGLMKNKGAYVALWPKRS